MTGRPWAPPAAAAPRPGPAAGPARQAGRTGRRVTWPQRDDVSDGVRAHHLTGRRAPAGDGDGARGLGHRAVHRVGGLAGVLPAIVIQRAVQQLGNVTRCLLDAGGLPGSLAPGFSRRGEIIVIGHRGSFRGVCRGPSMLPRENRGSKPHFCLVMAGQSQVSHTCPRAHAPIRGPQLPPRKSRAGAGLACLTGHLTEVSGRFRRSAPFLTHLTGQSLYHQHLGI